MELLTSLLKPSLVCVGLAPDTVDDGHILFVSSWLVVLRWIKKYQSKQKRNVSKEIKTKVTDKTLDYDVIIVGAGPAGSTAAFYAAKAGLKVGLFDKKAFPRNKPCGDAWCAPALDLLRDMGVLEKMEKDGITHDVKRGGFISPFGYACINTDGDSYGSVTGCKTYAIKREIADEYLFRAAGCRGATLHEGFEIVDAQFQLDDNYWLVTARADSKPTANSNQTVFVSRMLLICDGATSYLAQKLGIIPNGSQPEAVGSNAYIKDDAWKDADGVLIFNKSTLPGYSALFRHYNGDMYLGSYILPGGKATSRSIAPFETEIMDKHPYIKDALGDNYSWKKKRTVAPIRLGGVPRSYGSQALLVGDAAGHVDPLTGEGIHTAMIAGKIAAETLKDMFEYQNFSEQACQAYEARVYDSFVREFLHSAIAARVIYYFPITLDAVACVGNRRGQAFLDFFGEVMTGVKPKSAFLQPDLLVELALETAKQILLQYVLGKQPLVPRNIGQEVIDNQAGKKTGKFA
mmetsp:Transcript_16748/g.18152  ORF Transcript_16748/g.18152 Transcript_16748/m.18152 type:complete len:517 (-) Transcript_16748:41-1591(-)